MKKTKQLKLGHLNIYFIQQKLHDVYSIIDENKLDIFGLSETKLTETHPDNFLNITNYSFFRKNKKSLGETGLLVYYKQCLEPYIKRRTDLENFHIECIWIEIKFPHSPPILICNLYRNGKSDDSWFQNFADMMDKIKITNHEIILLGDFNINLFNSHPYWESILDIYNLKQQIHNPTRVCDSTSTLIDHIYTNSESKISNANVSPSGVSDHFPILCTFLLKVPKPFNNSHVTIETRSFKHFDLNAFLNDLSTINFTPVYYEHNPNQTLDLFYDLFLPLLDKHAPIKKRRVKQRIRPGWLTNEIIEEMNLRDMLSKNKKSPEYKKQRNKVTALVRKTKKCYYNKLIESNANIATLWRVTNLILGKHTTNRSTQPSKFTSDQFNDYFTSLGNNLVQLNYGSNVSFSIAPYLEEFCKEKYKERSCNIPLITENETVKYIKQLKNKKSYGTDNINIYLLKISLPFITKPLTHIYNTCIASNIFPDKLKHAKVIPLPKCKNANDLNDFRPISILNIISKPLEKHIHKHIYNFFETHSLFHPFQSGFRQKHSCHTASIRVVDTWLNNINDGKLNGAVFLDLKKAFDLVNHNILLEKISLYLQNDSTTNLLRSYLSQRTQTVYSDGAFSSYKHIPCGVPQGSILGPLLFCIYINDLALSISNQSLYLELFADDSNLHSSSKDIHSLNKDLQSGLDNIQNWCKSNRMILHPDKCKSMVITTRQKRQLHQYKLYLKINESNIVQVEEHKILGITVDHNLSWEKHINHLNKQLSKNLFLLSKLKPFLSSQCLRIFFNAHILSRINYCDSIWNQAANEHINKIDSLYKRGIKMISEEKYMPTSEKIRKLNYLPLKGHFFYNYACLIFKIQNNMTPEYLTNFISFSNRSNSNNLIVPSTRIDKFKSSFSFMAPTIWNKLPQNVRQTKTIGAYKVAVKKYINCWYTS